MCRRGALVQPIQTEAARAFDELFAVQRSPAFAKGRRPQARWMSYRAREASRSPSTTTHANPERPPRSKGSPSSLSTGFPQPEEDAPESHLPRPEPRRRLSMVESERWSRRGVQEFDQAAVFS